MQYTKLGRTGLDVSRICLGCMSYGGHQGSHAWSQGEDEVARSSRRRWKPASTFSTPRTAICSDLQTSGVGIANIGGPCAR